MTEHIGRFKSKQDAAAYARQKDWAVYSITVVGEGMDDVDAQKKP